MIYKLKELSLCGKVINITSLTDTSVKRHLKRIIGKKITNIEVVINILRLSDFLSRPQDGQIFQGHYPILCLFDVKTCLHLFVEYSIRF